MLPNMKRHYFIHISKYPASDKNRVYLLGSSTLFFIGAGSLYDHGNE